MSSKVIHPNDLLSVVNGLIILDLMDKAYDLIGDSRLDGIVEPPEGIYIKGALEPYFKYSEGLVSLNENGAPISHPNAASILNHMLDVVDSEGNMVLRASQLKDKFEYLTPEPTAPITIIKLAETIMLRYITTVCKYSRLTSKYSFYSLCGDADPDAIEEAIEEAYSPHMDELINFVANSTWNIYFKTMKGSTLIIEKSVDWRIYDWHMQQLPVDER